MHVFHGVILLCTSTENNTLSEYKVTCLIPECMVQEILQPSYSLSIADSSRD
jgi:hypothetical protein